MGSHIKFKHLVGLFIWAAGATSQAALPNAGGIWCPYQATPSCPTADCPPCEDSGGDEAGSAKTNSQGAPGGESHTPMLPPMAKGSVGAGSSGIPRGFQNITAPMTSKFGNVDVLSGLPDIHQVDLDHSSNGLFGLTLTRRYIGMTANYSENNNGMTMFGPHWMSNLEMRLECYACPEGGLLTQGGSLSLRLDHGYAVAFHAGANGAYRADPGQMAGTILHLNNPDPALANWRLTVDGEDATIEFNGYGRLLSMRDRNSQGIDLIYNSSQRLERVQAVAPDDRYLDFTYSNTVTNDPAAWRLVRVTPSWTGNYVEYTYKSKVPENNLDRINVVLWQVKDKHGRVYHQFDWTKQDQLPTNPALMESRLPRYAAPDAEYMIHRVGGSTNNSLRVLQAYRFLVTYFFPRCIGVFDSAGTRISWEVSTGTDPLTDYERN
jgi:hypothetical protein